MFSPRHDPKSKSHQRKCDELDYVKLLYSINMAKGPWNSSWQSSIPRRRINKEVSNPWVLQSRGFLAAEPSWLMFLKPSSLCSPCHRGKKYAKRHAAYTPHSWRTHSRPHYGGKFSFSQKKKKIFFLLLVVVNVWFFPAMGSKVPKRMTVSRKTRGQKSSIGSFSIFKVCEFSIEVRGHKAWMQIRMFQGTSFRSSTL